MHFGCYKLGDAFLKFLPVEGGRGSRGNGRRKRTPNPMYLALDQPWISIIPELLRCLQLLPPGERAEREWLQWVMPQVKHSPVPVVSVYDWYWWMSYSCKLQGNLLHLLFNQSHVTIEMMQSIVPFFAFEDFDQWSFHNHHLKMPDKLVWASHKQPLKEYIFKFDGDSEYYQGKAKIKSAHNPFGYQLGIDDKLNVICFGATSSSRMKMEAKYGDALLGLRS